MIEEEKKSSSEDEEAGKKDTKQIADISKNSKIQIEESLHESMNFGGLTAR